MTLGQIRVELHAKGLCPLVQLSGVGSVKALRLNTKAGDIVIHRRPHEAFVCLQFAELYEEKTSRKLDYHGESLASFCNKAFEGLMRPSSTRKQLTEEQR